MRIWPNLFQAQLWHKKKNPSFFKETEHARSRETVLANFLSLHANPQHNPRPQIMQLSATCNRSQNFISATINQSNQVCHFLKLSSPKTYPNPSSSHVKKVKDSEGGKLMSRHFQLCLSKKNIAAIIFLLC
jgi:hypothetical protein